VNRPVLIGNWKMHGDGGSLPAMAAIAGQAAAAPGVDVALCVPATLIHRAASLFPALAIGGQDCHHATGGAHTGEVAAAMLREAGARLVILGHSERRAAGDDDAEVAAKVRAAAAAGLRIVLCVGEGIDARRAGHALAVVEAQLHRSLDGAARADIVIAYEPVWAIGSGVMPTSGEVAAMAGLIRSRVGDAPILYGGSVTPASCEPLITEGGVDGFLVGGASLSPVSFGTIMALLGCSWREATCRQEKTALPPHA
jgi:triosephosphate isomerase